MIARPELADVLALALDEHGPLPASRLAAIVRRRKADVIAELHANPAFEQDGRRRGSTWRNGNHVDPPRNDSGTNPSGESGPDITRAEFELLRRRVDELERRLAETEALDDRELF